jgi:hypothetical protein
VACQPASRRPALWQSWQNPGLTKLWFLFKFDGES